MSDDPFVEDLLDSATYVKIVAEWIHRTFGLEYRIPSIEVRPELSRWREYSDNGDLFVLRDGWERLEVKHRNVPFTTASDFPWRSVFVCQRGVWDRAEQKPVAFITVNDIATHCAIVRADTEPHWVHDTVFDRRHHRMDAVYTCPTEHVTWHKMAEGI